MLYFTSIPDSQTLVKLNFNRNQITRRTSSQLKQQAFNHITTHNLRQGFNAEHISQVYNLVEVR